jgi:hypothetical protein
MQKQSIGHGGFCQEYFCPTYASILCQGNNFALWFEVSQSGQRAGQFPENFLDKAETVL